MQKRMVTILVAGLVAVTAVAAYRYWPTPWRRALARVEALNGSYLEQREGGRPQNTVNLTMRPVTEQDLAALRDLHPLHRLFLGGSRVTDTGLAQLGEFPELEYLDLSGTQVTDAGLIHLRGLQHLRTLALRQTRVTDAGLVYLRDLPALKFLTVVQTAVTDRGVEGLQRDHPGLEVELHVSDD